MSYEMMNWEIMVEQLKEKHIEILEKVNENSPWHLQPTQFFKMYLNTELKKLNDNKYDDYEKIIFFKISFNHTIESWRKIGKKNGGALDGFPKQYLPMANVLSAEFTPILEPSKISKPTKSANSIK